MMEVIGQVMGCVRVGYVGSSHVGAGLELRY